MNKEEEKILKELFYRIMLPALIIALVCLAFLATCNKQPIVKPPPNVLDKRIDSIKVTINKDSLVIDSLMKLKPKIITRYKTKYDTIYKQAPDTCKIYLTQLNNECLKLDSFNTGIITRQEIQLISYSELVGTMSEQSNMYVLRRNKDSLSILKLDKKLKRTRKIAVVEGLIIVTLGLSNGIK